MRRPLILLALVAALGVQAGELYIPTSTSCTAATRFSVTSAAPVPVLVEYVDADGGVVDATTVTASSRGERVTMRQRPADSAFTAIRLTSHADFDVTATRIDVASGIEASLTVADAVEAVRELTLESPSGKTGPWVESAWLLNPSSREANVVVTAYGRKEKSVRPLRIPGGGSRLIRFAPRMSDPREPVEIRSDEAIVILLRDIHNISGASWFRRAGESGSDTRADSEITETLMLTAERADGEEGDPLTFDVASQIPPGSTIRSVTLSSNGTSPAGLYPLSTSRGEAAVNGSTPATTAEDSHADATGVVVAPGGVVWRTTESLVARVQSWLDAPESNGGWVVRGKDVGATARVATLRIEFTPRLGVR